MKILKIYLALIGMMIILSCSSTRDYPNISQETFYCFSPLPPVFVSPYLSSPDSIYAKIVENGMAFKCVPAFENLDDTNEIIYVKHICYLSSPLEPGEYTVEITNRIAGNLQTTKAPLIVFEPKINNAEELTTSLGYLTIFGYSISDITFIPDTYGMIPPNQFRIKLMTDEDEDYPPLAGLSIPRDKGLFLDASASTFSMKVSWIQPITNKEVEIFSYGPDSISQNSPLVNLNNIITNTEDKGSKKMQVLARNLRIVKPVDGGGDNSEADIDVTVKGEFTGGLEGKANFIMEPKIREFPDGSYEIEAMIQVNPGENEKKIQGFVTLSIQAVAINSVNSVKSTPVNKTYDIPVTYEVEYEGGGWGPSPR
jgi:hypothetical protein